MTNAGAVPNDPSVAEKHALPRLLLIDDNQGQLEELKSEIVKRLDGYPAVVDLWQPVAGENLHDTLPDRLKPRPALVVTDLDLTEGGAAGLLGGDVAARCRRDAIPVGDYSDKHADELEEPDLFKFRFPSDPEDAASEIAELFTGFVQLTDLLAGRPAGSVNGWSNTLATVLGHEGASSAFSLYTVRSGSSHGASIERMQAEHGADEARRLLEIYVTGHLLKNGILRYPGPIMSDATLCSYLAISDDNVEAVAALFEQARYKGPFGRWSRYYWQDGVDERLVDLAVEEEMSGDVSDDAFRRLVMATRLQPGKHCCKHCDGDRGGFRCPYTLRTTCERADCSVPTTSWIPQGAHLCRVDRDYYDRWSPLLGF